MAEIKISELSIGDWVMFTPDKNVYVAEPRFTSAPAKITGTYCGGEVILEIECKREFMAIPLSCIEPIPLTPEILEKNGFVKNGEAYKIKLAFSQHLWLFKVGDGCCWVFRHILGLFEDFDITKVEIKYIHQLQHALRLAGVEKEIEV